MEINLALPALVNTAGAGLFALEGIAILLLARGARRALLIGGLATSFGLAYGVENLFVYVRTTAAPAAAFAACALAAFAFSALLIVDIAASLSRGLRRALAAFATLWAITLALTAAWIELHVELRIGLPYGADGWGRIAVYAGGMFQAALIVLLATIAARLATGGAGRANAAMACLAMAFGLWVVSLTQFNWVFTSALLASAELTLPAAGLAGTFLVTHALTLAAILAFLPRSNGSTSREQLAVLLAFVAAGLVGILVSLPDHGSGSNYGLFGIARTIGTVLLALAVLKYDLLGVPLPRLAARRGALATGALAMLLIVAQIAQNFLSAQYGLLMGGIVAGAFVFAASPIQRAMERRDSAPAAPTRRSEESYRKAVRLALRDRRLTREEETHLHELARDLGIDGPRAHAILGEVEAELAGGAR